MPQQQIDLEETWGALNPVRRNFAACSSNFKEIYEFTDGVKELRIAASDASDEWKATAQYICDGTNDEAEINAAIAEIAANTFDVALAGHDQNTSPNNGGKIVLSPGTFYMQGGTGSGRIQNTSANNLWIQGSGPSTVIISSRNNKDVILLDGSALTYGLNRQVVSDLTIVGYYNSDADKSLVCLSFKDCQYQLAWNVHTMYGIQGISMSSSAEAKGAQNKSIIGCQCQWHTTTGGDGVGINLSNTHDTLVTNTHIEECDRGILVTNNAGLYIANCNIEDNLGYALHLVSGQMPTIVGGIIEGSVYLAPSVVSAAYINGSQITSIEIVPSVTGCAIYSSGVSGSTLTVSGAVIFHQNHAATRFATVNINNTGGGIVTFSSCRNNAITSSVDNDCSISISGGYNGISTLTATNLSITGGIIAWNSSPVVSVDTLVISGLVSWTGSPTLTAQNDNARFLLANNVLSSVSVAFQGTGAASQLSIVGNVFDTVTGTVDDFPDVLQSSNVFDAGNWTYDNVDGNLDWTGNAFRNTSGLVINSTCAATPKFAGNVLTGRSLTNNGTAATEAGNI